MCYKLYGFCKSCLTTYEGDFCECAAMLNRAFNNRTPKALSDCQEVAKLMGIVDFEIVDAKIVDNKCSRCEVVNAKFSYTRQLQVLLEEIKLILKSEEQRKAADDAITYFKSKAATYTWRETQKCTLNDVKRMDEKIEDFSNILRNKFQKPGKDGTNIPQENQKIILAIGKQLCKKPEIIKKLSDRCVSTSGSLRQDPRGYCDNLAGNALNLLGHGKGKSSKEMPKTEEDDGKGSTSKRK